MEFFISQLNAKFSFQISQAINQIKKFGPDFEKSLSNKPMMVFFKLYLTFSLNLKLAKEIIVDQK